MKGNEMFALILLITLSAGAPTPEEAVEQFFKDFDSGDYQNAWKMITPSSAEYLQNAVANVNSRSTDYGTEATKPKDGEALEKIGKSLKGKVNLMPDEIVGSVVKKDHAYVIVKYDLQRLANQALADTNQVAIANNVIQKLPSRSIALTFEASMEKDGWKFDLGLINMGVGVFTNYFGPILTPSDKPSTTESNRW
jgi:hypothetical protein